MFWLLGCVALVVAVLAPPQVDSLDAKVRLAVTRSMLWSANIDIEPPAYHAVLAPVGVDGRHYSIYPIGQSLIFVPLELASEGLVQFSRALGWRGSESSADYLKDALIAGTYLVVINVLLALALFRLQRRLGLSSRSSTLGVSVLLLSTQWLTWGRSLQEEVLAALLLSTAALAGLAAAKGGSLWRNAIWYGVCMGLLANVRYNGVFAAAGLCIWIGFALGNTNKRVRFAAAGICAMAPWICLAAWYNHARFGGVLRSGYHAAMQQGQISAWSFDATELMRLLAGGDYGLLFFWLPALLLLACWRSRGILRTGVATLVIALVVHVLFLAGVYVWARGEGCAGPRFVCHHLISLSPFMWVGALRVWRSWPVARPIIAGVLAFSMAVQLSCVLFTGELENMQQRARAAAGLETAPAAALPRRFANILRLADGTLLEYSFPRELGQSSVNQFSPESFEVAARPNLTPWRVAGGIRARQMLSPWIVYVVWSLWGAAVIALALSAARTARLFFPGSQ